MNNQKDANSVTWEELNPDWMEDGDLTDRFAKSQFADCPGCGDFKQIRVAIAGEDYEVVVYCPPCGWTIMGDTPSEALENWNKRTPEPTR